MEVILRKIFSREHRPALIIIIAMILFVLFFGAADWFRQVNLFTAQYDMGNMEQVLWQTIHGHIFQMNNVASAGLVPRTMYHADFLLLIYTPFYALFPDPRTMMIMQVIFVATGAIPVYWIARKRLGQKIGALISIAYLAYPTLQWATMFDVHAVLLCAPLLLWAWWAATEKKWWIYGMMVGLAILGKEEVGFVVALMGVYWAFRRGYRTMGMITIAVGIIWSSLMFGWAIPSARTNSAHFALRFYSDFGDSYSTIIKNVLAHPQKVFTDVFGSDGRYLLTAILVPTILLPIIGLPILLIGLPELLINMLSNYENQHAIFYQYYSVVVPFVFLATIDGWVRLQTWINTYKRTAFRSLLFHRILVGLFVVGSLACVWFFAPLPATRSTSDAVKTFWPSPYREDVMKIKTMLPANARVAATNNIIPQFAQRDMIWGFPDDLQNADAIIVLEGGKAELATEEIISQHVDELLTNPAYTLTYHHDLLYYFTKR